jgi:hypothetical protein
LIVRSRRQFKNSDERVIREGLISEETLVLRFPVVLPHTTGAIFEWSIGNKVAIARINDSVATDSKVQKRVLFVDASLVAREAVLAHVKIAVTALAAVIESLFVEDMAITMVAELGHFSNVILPFSTAWPSG